MLNTKDEDLEKLTNRELLVMLGTSMVTRNNQKPSDTLSIDSVTYGQYDFDNYEENLISQTIYCDGTRAFVRCVVDSLEVIKDLREVEYGHLHH